jgi:GNAT superfamily N-acetyltransferase
MQTVNGETGGSRREPESLRDLDAREYDGVVELLARAFATDPGFRQVARAQGECCRGRILEMVRVSLDVHAAAGHGVRGIVRGGQLLAVALAEDPGRAIAYGAGARALARLMRTTNPAVALRSLRASLGPLRRRPREPHHFLSMLAVRPSTRGQGLGRLLLEDLHAACESHPRSTGVALDTSNPRNLSFYERFGYHLVASLQIGGLQAWCMFRPRQSEPA